MILLTHWAGLRVGEVACLRWSDVTTTDREIKDEIRLLPGMTTGRCARTVFVSVKLKAKLQTYLANKGTAIHILKTLVGHSCLPLQQSQFAQGGGGVGLKS